MDETVKTIEIDYDMSFRKAARLAKQFSNLILFGSKF